MFKFYTRNRCKPPGYAQNLLRAIQIAAFIILATNPQIVHAQSSLIDVKGIVYDDQGKPLVGASVRIKGTERVIKTNEEGIFYLSDVNVKATVVVSFVGFEAQELVAAAGLLNFTLAPKTGKLDEVEILSTGYQNLNRDKTTGSIVQISNKLLNRSVSTNILDRIKNLAPGIYFQDRDPQLSKIANFPNDRNSGITVRGQSTLSASKEPLIILDNFPYEGEINNINPNDIESISILKDAAAASIWGARSGNGVIVITTKKGKLNQKLVMDFTANTTITSKPDLKYSRNFLDAKSYIEVEQLLFDKGFFNTQINDNISFPFVSPAVELMDRFKNATSASERSVIQGNLDKLKAIDVRDDYSKYLYQQSVNQQYSLGLRGGTDKLTYSTSASHDKNKNNLINNDFERTTLNTLTSYRPLNKIEVSLGLNYSKTKSTLNNEFSYGSFSGLGALYQGIYPYAHLADDTGIALPVQQNLRLPYLQTAASRGYLDWTLKPLEEIDIADHNISVADLLIRFGVKYHIHPTLNLELNYQNEHQTIDEKNLRPIESYYARNLINKFTSYNSTNGALTYAIPKGGILDLSNTQWSNNSVRGQINFDKAIGEHNFSALAGLELKESNVTGFNRTSYGYNDQFGTAVNNLNYASSFPTSPSGSAIIPAPSGSVSGVLNRSISYFIVGTYQYKKKYTLNFSSRKDGANLFGASVNDKFKPFLSIGLGWDMHKESFYNIDWLPYLKVRSSIGYQGNTYQSGSAYLTAFYTPNDFTGIPSLNVTTPPNPRLQWERVKTSNIALDFSAFKNTLGGSIEIFRKNGKDLIQPSGLPAQTGFTTYLANTASTVTNGIDVNIQSENLKGRLRWSTSFIFSKIKDRVTKYDVPFTNSSISSGGYVLNKPLLSIFSYKWAGLNPSNGNPRGFINGQVSENYSSILTNYNPDSLAFKGSAVPTTYGSIRNDFDYAGFSLSVNIVYRLGYFFRRTSTSISYANLIKSGQNMDYASRWQNPGDEKKTNVPSIVYPSDPTRDSFYQLSEILVESADHIRLQDIRLGYTVSNPILKSLKIANLSIFSYANNLGIIWRKNKIGIDPSAVGNNASTYPNPFTLSFGINAKF